MKKTAIILAAFGASRLDALKGITNIVERVRGAFDDPVEVCFTSNIVRSVWQKRLNQEGWLSENPQTPDYVKDIRGPLATIAGLQDKGYKTQVIQPLHMYAGEEYHDLRNYVTSLAGIQTVKTKWRPFEIVALGRPALGAPGTEHPYMDDIQRAAQVLESDVRKARAMGAALVYVGHGNHIFSSGVYNELKQVLVGRNPDVTIEVGEVEGIFDAGYVAEKLSGRGVRRVLLKPLMVVAGVHARDDMAGDDEDSWLSVLRRAGMEVECGLQGLGEKDAWADLYLQNIHECAADAGIELSAKVD